jgi:hypothetical protein
VALIRTDVSENRIASIFRVHECEQVTERSCKLLYRQRRISYDNQSRYCLTIMMETVLSVGSAPRLYKEDPRPAEDN